MRALVAGGGVAGAAAACLLGRDCVLVEREGAAHDKICGEFVSAEAAPYLRRLGLDLPALGATRIDAVRVVYGDRVARSPLPFPAFGLSRRVLDAALLARAAALGAEVVRGHTVRGIADGVAEVAGLGRFPGHAVFLATGKHDLRGVRRLPTRPPEDLVGLKMYFAVTPDEAAELAGHVEILLFRGGYAGLQVVEAGAVNLCLLLEQRRFSEAGQSWSGVQSMLETEIPHLARRLRGARPLLERPLSIFRVPYGYVHRPGADDPAGLYRLGDQAGVIPSFCGDGVSIALHSAFASVSAHRGLGAAAYHRRLHRDIGRQIGRAMAVYRIGRAAPGLITDLGRLWPGALGWIARLTRVPSWALERP
ncbi:MAG: NAD(P)/FAD-dependent oxidoreductase [Acetobacteraceae bacterium]